jgi:hypothetical protein
MKLVIDPTWPQVMSGLVLFTFVFGIWAVRYVGRRVDKHSDAIAGVGAAITSVGETIEEQIFGIDKTLERIGKRVEDSVDEIDTSLVSMVKAFDSFVEAFAAKDYQPDMGGLEEALRELKAPEHCFDVTTMEVLTKLVAACERYAASAQGSTDPLMYSPGEHTRRKLQGTLDAIKLAQAALLATKMEADRVMALHGVTSYAFSAARGVHDKADANLRDLVARVPADVKALLPA